MAAAHPSKLEKNIDALSAETSVLTHLRSILESRKEPQIRRWLQKVKDRVNEVDEFQKELDELKSDSHPNKFKGRINLNKKVIESLKAVRFLKEEGDENSESIEMFISEPGEVELKRFSYEQLKSFKSDVIIGSGGFGDVYQGQFPDGVQVAIKVLRESAWGDVNKQFMAEVSTMCTTTNPNLVKLHGFCFYVTMKALVYEYMERGSFDTILYKKDPFIEWKKLYNIATETAKGIAHLHEKPQNPIIHLDIKPSNVLLDSSLSPKVTDFGLARIYKSDQSYVTQTHISGTRGYTAPEVLMGSRAITYKCDVFSFGIMLFEVLRRMRINEGEEWFPMQVWENYSNGQLDQIFTECGIGDNDKEKAEVLSIVALCCTQHRVQDRPDMSDVVKVLEGRMQPREPPNPPHPYNDMGSSARRSGSLTSGSSGRSSSSVPSDSSARSSGSVSSGSTAISSGSGRNGPPLSPATSIEELLKRLSNLESENQVLRQQAFSSGPKLTTIQRTSENENIQNAEGISPSVSALHELESAKRLQNSPNDTQLEKQELLIKCMSQDLGFSEGRPVAACFIYKCLLHWGLFGAERTSVFDRIIQTIASCIEKVQENTDTLSYWLCNSSTLLTLLERSLKASGAASLIPQRRSASLFGRMTQGFRGYPQNAASSQVEAKYPALLFKQQLSAYLEKIYKMIRDDLKKEISPMLALCIQVPRTSRASLLKGPRSQQRAVVQQALSAHWQSIVKIFNNYLKTLRANYVPPFLVRKVFTQIFSYANVQLFNSLLLRRECCSFSNGEYVKAGLAELELWCVGATEEYAGDAWNELKHIRQAVSFLVIHQKPKMTLNGITKEICPVLNIQQLYRISTMYWDDKYGTHSVSPDVIAEMRIMMTEDSNNAVSSSFLLDDDSSIPFSVNDISKSMRQIDLADIEPPPLLRENSEFAFLLQPAE